MLGAQRQRQFHAEKVALGLLPLSTKSGLLRGQNYWGERENREESEVMEGTREKKSPIMQSALIGKDLATVD
jgi:hypothetical protein|tara:strand:+ start:783 stop:998 length:216 start_codon:yes stop_codon:yes gene_type:complete